MNIFKSIKKGLWILVVFSILSNAYLVYINRELKAKNIKLEDENNDLEEQVRNLENEVEELEANFDKKEREDLFSSQDEPLISTFQTSEIINDLEDNSSTTKPLNGISNLNIPLSNSLQTTNFNQVQLISPSLDNLHYLFSLSETNFERIMSDNEYSLSTTNDCFVSPSPIRYCTIKKEMQSVNMIFTKNIRINNNIEESLNNVGIDYTYDEGFKIYIYMYDNLKFALYIKTDSNGVFLALRNI